MSLSRESLASSKFDGEMTLSKSRSRSISPSFPIPYTETDALIYGESLESISNPANWWKVFTQVVRKSNADFKISLDSAASAAPPSPEKSMDWSIAVASQILASQKNEVRRGLLQFIVNTSNGINFIIATLKNSLQTPNGVWLTFILRECANPRNGNLRSSAMRKLVESEEHLDCIIKMLILLQNLSINAASTQLKADYNLTTINLIWVLSAIAQKDSNFVLKVRTISKVKFLHGLIKTHFFGKHHTHYPLLKILRVLARNYKVSIILGKDKVMKLILRMFNTFNNQPSSKFLIVFDVLSQLTKHKENCQRFLKAGLLISMMRAFSYWSLWKGNGLLKLSKNVMSIYDHLSSTRAGKKALVTSDALLNLKKFCEQCPQDRSFDEMIMKAVSITYVAHRKDKLPLDDIQSPAKFDVSKGMKGNGGLSYDNNKDSGSSSDEDDPDDMEDVLDSDGDDGSGDLEEPESGFAFNDDIDNDNEDELITDQDNDSSSGLILTPSTSRPKNKDKDKRNLNQDMNEKNSMGCSGISGMKAGERGDQEPSFMSSSTSQPPEMFVERLSGFAPFFRELDGCIGDNANVFDPLVALKSSLVLECVDKTEIDFDVKRIPNTELKFFWLTDHPDYGSSASMINLRSTYTWISNRVRSVIPWVKVAYPDLVLAYGSKRVEFINPPSDRTCLRNKLLLHISRAGQELFKPKVVYDLDSLVKGVGGDSGTPSGGGGTATGAGGEKSAKGSRKSSSKPTKLSKVSKVQPSKAATCLTGESSLSKMDTDARNLGNDDELMVGSFDGCVNKRDVSPFIPSSLKFESRFESGNLRKAIQVVMGQYPCLVGVGPNEYDLYLMSDVNSNRHNQWFYFQVSNTMENTIYTFNIINCIKGNSQFNYGMQPVIFSVGDALEGKAGWHRCGSGICYYRNGIRNLSGKSKRKKVYYTATFTLTFQRRGDVCYIAYHYPYTYTRLLTELSKMLKMAQQKNQVLVRYDVLCKSLNDNEVPLITVTAPNESSKPIELREIIFLTSRVHPGESNSSWVMHGILHNLLFPTENMENMLKRYVFKIVPMLNVEGVLNGCHRCGLTNEDLNRRWKNPDPVLHPTIYSTKSLIEFCCKVRNKIPVLYCDLHGHSRKKNVFFYGCSRARSWCGVDRTKGEDPNTVQALPEAVARRSPAFALSACNFEVRKSRETTARVAVWREFGIARSYTLESSYCGCDRGPYKGLSLGINHLIEVGENLCEAVEEFQNPPISSASEYAINCPQRPGVDVDPSKINFCNLEEPSWSDKIEAPSPASSETDFGNSETDDEWNQGSLNPIIF